MNPIPCVCRLAFGLSCFALTSWSASISYPNRAYIFSEGYYAPLPEAFSNVKAVAVEDNKVLAVTQDGRVVTSGVPQYQFMPDAFDHLTNIVAVGLNYTSAAALTADGTVIELVHPETRNQPPGLDNVIALDVVGQDGDDDLDYMLAVTGDERVVFWDRFNEALSVHIPGVIFAAGGWHHIVALKRDGTVVQLEFNTIPWELDGEPEIVEGLSNVVAVAAGGQHSLALKADGTLAAWANDSPGELEIPEGLSNVVAIAASESHNLALKSNGTLAAWGQGYLDRTITPPSNLTNVMAIATSGRRSVVIANMPELAPVSYPNQAYHFLIESYSAVSGFTNLKAFAVEDHRMLGVTREGRVLGSGVSTFLAPQEFLNQLTNIADVGLSYIDAAALTARGAVIDFGEDPLPMAVARLDNVICLDVTGQFNDDDVDYKLVVTSDGRVLYWGRYWELRSMHVPGVISAAGGWSHIVALKSDGTVVQWEIHDDHETTIVEGLSNVVAVAAGGEHSVALKADGTVQAWGENYEGQLDIPEGLSNVVAISASESHTLALKRDGTLAAWGASYYGEDITPSAELNHVVAIATSGNTNLALVSFPSSGPALAVAGFNSDPALLTLSLSGMPNHVYEIQSTRDFQIWEFLRYVTNQTATTTFDVEIIDPDKRFYRAR